MSLRLLSSVMIALAMLFAPIGIAGGSAMAMAPAAEHHAEMMEAGHCEDPPTPDHESQPDGKSCCTAMCTAIAVAPPAPVEPLSLTSSPLRAPLAASGPSFLVELPTPPPRRA